MEPEHKSTIKNWWLGNFQDSWVEDVLNTGCFTMVYTKQEAEKLAKQAVEKTEQEANKELPEEEKERIWKLVIDACK